MKKDVFKYPDTNSSRAKIDYLNNKFRNLKIAIIGMGGTGSYILDQVSKTPVSEIHIYDGDFFQLHNAFRAPGAVVGEKLDVEGGLKKVDYYCEVYSNMHTGIIPHAYYVTKKNLHELKGFDYVFIAIDKNEARSIIIKGLLEIKIPFIDVGMGVNINEDYLVGTLRVTVGTPSKNDHLSNRIGSEEFEDNEYSTNIQIADLNCLNAMFAVIKWKRMCGFYQNLKTEHHQLYFVTTNKILNEDY